jgi:hypothetical protein
MLKALFYVNDDGNLSPNYSPTYVTDKYKDMQAGYH